MKLLCFKLQENRTQQISGLCFIWDIQGQIIRNELSYTPPIGTNAFARQLLVAGVCITVGCTWRVAIRVAVVMPAWKEKSDELNRFVLTGWPVRGGVVIVIAGAGKLGA